MRIETERVVLRRWAEGDVDALARIHSDPAVAAWLGPLTEDDAACTVERYEHHWDVHGFGRFAVTDRATGALVGRVGVMRQPDWTETPEKDEVGWVVAADRWGEGLATEAAGAAIADAFGRVGLDTHPELDPPRQSRVAARDGEVRALSRRNCGLEGTRARVVPRATR